MKHQKLLIYLTWSLILIIFLMADHSQAKDKIRIGNPIALSGINAPGAMMTQIRSYDMWVEDVNARGGIYVKELGKKLPVEIIRYDDKSDIGTTVKLFEKLVLDEKVDFIFPPWGTAFHFAIAPLTTKYKTPVLGPTCSSLKLKEMAHTIPYMFITLNQPWDHGGVIVDLCLEVGVKKAAVIHHTDLHGIEMATSIVPMLVGKGVDILLYKSFPLGVKDLSPLLKEIKQLNVDALIASAYPPENFLMVEQMMTIGLNPKLFFSSVGIAYPSFRDKFGVAAVEGILGTGCWNPKVSPAAKEWFDRYTKRWKVEPDRWGTAQSYATGQILEKAIEIAGTLEPTKVRDVIARETFDTILGRIKFENQFAKGWPGHVGQWQKGEFMVVDKATRQAKPIYPKPEWPKK
jgi:branched-chain amino acid transport system substrate-binding protein